MLTYPLPKELIARRPCEPRDAARLLVVDRRNAVPGTSDPSGTWYRHQTFRDLPGLLRPGDCLVLNDTAVIPARLRGRREGSGGKVELLLLERYPENPGTVLPNPAIQKEIGQNRPGVGGQVWRCIGQPGRRLRPGARLSFNHGSLKAEVLPLEGKGTGLLGGGPYPGQRRVRFEGENVPDRLKRLGEVPLPPYIGRKAQPRDAEWYQTVYARQEGAVAAPTAGLHFTRELLEALRARGVRVASLTLHVGWGTFRPVGEAERRAGRLHPERFRVPEETRRSVEETKAAGGRVVAVGTTVVRALETWKQNLDSVSGAGTAPGTGFDSTDLYIRPGFRFRAVDALITNFHLPGTSLLELVAAFAGEETTLAAYRTAVEHRYRFYSYGDAMFIA